VVHRCSFSGCHRLQGNTSASTCKCPAFCHLSELCLWNVVREESKKTFPLVQGFVVSVTCWKKLSYCLIVMPRRSIVSDLSILAFPNFSGPLSLHPPTSINCVLSGLATRRLAYIYFSNLTASFSSASLTSSFVHARPYDVSQRMGLTLTCINTTSLSKPHCVENILYIIFINHKCKYISQRRPA
jgi:hypothetical protein